MYAGTGDMVAGIGGKLNLFDFKSSKDGRVYDEVELQLSAYGEAFGKPCGLIAVGLAEDGTYTHKKVENKYDTFLSVKRIWEWKNAAKCEKVGYKV